MVSDNRFRICDSFSFTFVLFRFFSDLFLNFFAPYPSSSL